MKINIGVVFGGKSVEHEISIISACEIMGYIDENHTFNPNSNYEYGNEAYESCFYDSIGIIY